MDWKPLRLIGIGLTFLLTFVNAVIRNRERQMEVHPLIKYPLAWIQLLLIPGGAVAIIVGAVLAQGIRDDAVMNLGLALVFTGFAGMIAMEIGENHGRQDILPVRTITYWSLMFLLIMACFFWARRRAG